MASKILIAYASEFGATRKVAELIGLALRDGATNVDVRLVMDVRDLGSYDAVIVGSAIYNGAWLPEAVHFIRFYEAELARVPTAYFVVSMTMRQDTPDNRRTVLAYLDPALAATSSVRPVGIGLFGGMLRYRNLPLFVRLLFWLRERLPSGDYRDWRAIRRWAAQIRPALVGDEAGRDAV